MPGLLAVGVELPALQRGLEDVHGWDPDSEDDLGPGLSEGLGDGPSETLVIGDAGDEGLLSCVGRRR